MELILLVGLTGKSRIPGELDGVRVAISAFVEPRLTNAEFLMTEPTPVIKQRIKLVSTDT
jgi:hypothetical protein